MEVKKSSESKCLFGISSLDLAGEKHSFEFPTVNRKLKTRIGGIISMIIGLVAILATVLLGAKFFDTSSPSITFSNQIGPNDPHNLAQELLVPPVTVYMEGSPILADISRFATIKATFTHLIFNVTTGQGILNSYVVSDFVNCKELNDPYYNKLLSVIDDNNRFKGSLQCPDFKGNYSLSELSSTAVIEKPEVRSVVILISPCSREDSSECVSPTSTKELKLMIAKTKKTIEPSNYTHPYKIRVSMEEISIDPYRTKYLYYQTKLKKIVDLRNEIFGEKERDQFLTSTLLSQNSILRLRPVTTCPKLEGAAFTRSCPEYIELVHRRGQVMIKVKRQYYSPTQIIGEIGGVLKVALMFVMVYAFYIKMRMKSFIIENVYSRKNNRENDRGKLKILNRAQTESNKNQALG